MRYRILDANGDYSFGYYGTPRPEFYVDQPEAVAQAIQTRLLLMAGEWFLNLQAGTPYNTQILGKGTQMMYDAAIRARILGTPGVSALLTYSSAYNSAQRSVAVTATVLTLYSQEIVPVNVALSGPSPLPNTTIDAFGNVTLQQPIPSAPAAPTVAQEAAEQGNIISGASGQSFQQLAPQP